MEDVIEFYDGSALVATVHSSMMLLVGSLISIRKKTWVVTRVTYALDNADIHHLKEMRTCVDIREAAK